MFCNCNVRFSGKLSSCRSFFHFSRDEDESDGMGDGRLRRRQPGELQRRHSTADSRQPGELQRRQSTVNSRQPGELQRRQSTVDSRQPDDFRRTTIRQPCDIRHSTCDKLMASGPSEVESRMSCQGCRTTTVECPARAVGCRMSNVTARAVGCRMSNVECHGKGRRKPCISQNCSMLSANTTVVQGHNLSLPRAGYKNRKTQKQFFVVTPITISQSVYHFL